MYNSQTHELGSGPTPSSIICGQAPLPLGGMDATESGLGGPLYTRPMVGVFAHLDTR